MECIRARWLLWMNMLVEIWSDVVCPWCYIGKRRFEAALAAFPHRDDVDVVWRSYQLDPTAPTEPVGTVAEHLGQKYGGGLDAGQRMVDQVSAVAAQEGMTWRLGEAQRANTLDAHRLLHLAQAEGAASTQSTLKEALLEAYFVRAENVADHRVLRDAAIGAGLDPGRVDAVLAGEDFADEVRADQAQAAAFGATGVPFFVIDRTLGVSGAQPAATFTQALERAWAESHPKVELIATPGDADACGPDGCAI